jgi:hypothetical protein
MLRSALISTPVRVRTRNTTGSPRTPFVSLIARPGIAPGTRSLEPLYSSDKIETHEPKRMKRLPAASIAELWGTNFLIPIFSRHAADTRSS